MGKRYAFFRDPTGKPYRGSDGRFAPAQTLAALGLTSRPGPNGQIQWDGFSFQQREGGIRALLVIVDPDNEELNEHDAWRMGQNALFALAKLTPAAPITPTAFLSAIDTAAAAHFRQPSSQYFVATSLSVSKLPGRSIRIRGSRISTLRRNSTGFRDPTIVGRLFGRPFEKHREASKYCSIKIRVEGRSVHEAIEKGITALDLLRGLWSLPATYGHWSFQLGGGRRPLGVIHKGPLHTLHLPDGTPAHEDLYWYDPEYSEDRRLFTDEEKWDKIEAKRRALSKKIAKLPHRQEVENLLIRYAGALDQENPDLALLQMWGILERLTDTVGAQYDETIKRATWIFNKRSRPLVKERLDALRFYRNRYVHSGGSTQDADQIAYMLKASLDPHLFFLIDNVFQVSSLQEYAEYLRLPTDVEELGTKFERMQRAYRLAKKWQKAEEDSSDDD